jgi:hypothetical protein
MARRHLARTFTVEMEGYGYDDCEAHLAGVAARTRHPFTNEVFIPLQKAEARHFDRLAPDFHKTGRLRESFTTNRTSTDALRELHGTRVAFGSKVPYARAAASRGGSYLLVIDRKGREDFVKVVSSHIAGHGKLRRKLDRLIGR